MTLRVVLSARIEGVRVLEARNGCEALEILGRERVDCVVSDLVMPEMDGTTMLAELITRGFRVPVIVVSAYAAPSPPIECALVCVAKPVDLELLCATIARVLASSASGGEAALIGLLHVLSCSMRSCTVEVTSRGGGVTRRGAITMRSGTVTQARASIENGVALTRVGLDAAADILGWDGPEVRISGEASSSVADARVDEALTTVFAYAVARRRAATARRG